MNLPARVQDFTPAQIQTIRRTAAKDATDQEFDLFMAEARAYGLNPFQKQIIQVIYNKDKPAKRQATTIVTRDGKRVLASRCGDYRPASEPPEIIYSDEAKSSANPTGLVSASVRLWKQDRNGDWFPVFGMADWDEFAPIVERWEENRETGRREPSGVFELAPGNWRKMPKLMLTKCAEAQALRAGWPETFGGLYGEEEMDRRAADISASQELEEYERQERMARVGGPGLMLAFDSTARLEKIKMGEVFDRVDEYLEGADPQAAMEFQARNEIALREFWAHDKAAALALKKKLEAKADAFAKSIQSGNAA